MLGVDEFKDYFPKAVKILEDYLDSMTVSWVKDHFLKLINYSTAGGKMTRGISCSSTFLELTKVDPSDRRAEIGYRIGWALELLQAAFLVADDLMDQSETRRGNKCWYKLDNIGDTAVNDTFLLENLAIALINSLQDDLLSCELVDAVVLEFRRVCTLTTMGQTYDYKAHDYTFECLDSIQIHKTSYYSFWLPIVAGIIPADCIPKSLWNDGKLFEFLLLFGKFFQAQDDYLDLYGDPSVTGKLGSDIQDGKVTWFACMFMKKANDEQKSKFLENYGHKDSDPKVVLKLFEDIHIIDDYNAYIQTEGQELQRLLNNIDPSLPVKTLQCLLSKVLPRNS